MSRLSLIAALDAFCAKDTPPGTVVAIKRPADPRPAVTYAADREAAAQIVAAALLVLMQPEPVLCVPERLRLFFPASDGDMS